MVQEEPPRQTAPAHQQKDEHRCHRVGGVEQHTVDEAVVHEIDDAGGHGDHAAEADEIPLARVLPQDRVQPAHQKADEVKGHDPRQIIVEQRPVMGPPRCFHRTIGTEQQRKVKAEQDERRIQHHQNRPAQPDLRRDFFDILHKKSSLPSASCPAPVYSPQRQKRACSAMVSIVLYSFPAPVSRNFPRSPGFAVFS